MDFLPTMSEKTATTNVYRYLPCTPKDRSWGCYVTAVGSHNVPPGYLPFADPNGHQLWRKRRVLKDYGIIYLAKGGGVFRSRDTAEIRLTAGDALLLFPNVWHRYRPDPNTGWQEHWLLFNGNHPDRLLEHKQISPASPVFHVGVGERVEELFTEIMAKAQAQPSQPNRIMAALTGLILAHTVSTVLEAPEGESSLGQDVVKAQWFLEERVHGDFDMAELAVTLEMSFSTLSRRFRQTTGLTPHQYHMQLRINRAKELLEEPELMVKQISKMLGFNDQYYFSRIFKKHTGYSPMDWRKTVGRSIQLA